MRIAGQDFISLFREYNLQRLQSKQEEPTEEDEAAANDDNYERLDEENQIKRKGGRQKLMVGV